MVTYVTRNSEYSRGMSKELDIPTVKKQGSNGFPSLELIGSYNPKEKIFQLDSTDNPLNKRVLFRRDWNSTAYSVSYKTLKEMLDQEVKVGHKLILRHIPEPFEEISLNVEITSQVEKINE